MRPLRILIIAFALLSLTAVPACTRSSGSKDKFCGALPDTDDVFALIDDLDATDSARLEQRFDAGLAEFRELERAAPRQIRSDVAVVADAVERILQAVQQHPDDMGAVREELGRSSASLLGSGKSALALRDYARDECGITLGGGSSLTTTATTPTTGPTTTSVSATTAAGD
ncbi:MAG: hypothetical protein WKF43_07785 [Acidimicrobiales bacterium]